MNIATILDIAVGVIVGFMSVLGGVLLAGLYIRKKIRKYLNEGKDATTRR